MEALPDATVTVILDNMKPALRDGRYGDAVLQGVEQMGRALAGQDIPAGGGGAGGSNEGWGIFAFFGAIVASVFGYSWWSSRKETKRYRSCQDKLAAIRRDQDAIRRKQYASSSCPICLEEFTGTAPAPPGASSSTAAEGGGPGESEPLLARESGGAGSSAAGPSRIPSGSSSGSGSKKVDKGGKAAAAAGGGHAAKEKKPLVLRCGHAFCEPCISEWLKSHTNCPICRKDLDGDDPPSSSTRTTPPPPNTCNPQQHQQQRWGMYNNREEWLMAEQMYRLRRLQYFYPDYISDMTLRGWEDDLRHDRDLNPAPFNALDPSIRRELEDRGAGGSGGMSFGGGGSSGGGGAGSSW